MINDDLLYYCKLNSLEVKMKIKTAEVVFSLAMFFLCVSRTQGQAAPGNCTQFSNAAATAFATASASGKCIGVDSVTAPTVLHVPVKLSVPSINSVILVDGTVYPLTASGIQSALNAVSSSGGKVVLPPTSGSPINMGSSNLTLSSNVCLVGAGPGQQTVLRWTSNVNAIVIPKGTSHACVEDLALSFSPAASVSSAGLRIDGNVSTSQATQYNTFSDIYITFDTLNSGTDGIFAVSSGTASTDISLNTFNNITVSLANQMVNCTNCEGNFWTNVQGVNLGTNAATLFSETNGNDEFLDIRVESGSANGTNTICFATSGLLNIGRITCDTANAATAINDTGGHNIFQVDLVGQSTFLTVGTVSPTSILMVSPGTDKTPYIQTPSVTLSSSPISSLGTPANGTITYCSNCTTTNPCGAGGNGAIAKRLNGAWVCN
jgi:hypothetical protein